MNSTLQNRSIKIRSSCETDAARPDAACSLHLTVISISDVDSRDQASRKKLRSFGQAWGI